MPIAHNAVVQRLRDAVVELKSALRVPQRCLQEVDLAPAHRLTSRQQVPGHAYVCSISFVELLSNFLHSLRGPFSAVSITTILANRN